MTPVINTNIGRANHLSLIRPSSSFFRPAVKMRHTNIALPIRKLFAIRGRVFAHAFVSTRQLDSIL